MRLPRPRFTIRRMMVVVALLCLILGPGVEGLRLIELVHFYRQAAINARDAAKGFRNTATALAVHQKGLRTEDVKIRRWLHTAEEKWIEYAEYHQELAPKYDRAARHPWIPIDFSYDPPEYPPFSPDWHQGPK
jgi:hypothetical protein